VFPGFSAPATVQLLNQPLASCQVSPYLYLTAAGEVFAITLLVTWAITWTWYPEQITEHPARQIIGASNPCFGWDYAPASYIAVTFCSVNVFLTWRYCYLTYVWAYLLQKEAPCFNKRFVVYTGICLALASNVWMLLWLIGPANDKPGEVANMAPWFVHMSIFVGYEVCKYVANWAAFIDLYSRRNDIQQAQVIFMAIMGISLLYMVFVYFYDLLQYQKGQPPALPPILIRIANITYFGCLLVLNSFKPTHPPPLLLLTSLVEPEGAAQTSNAQTRTERASLNANA